MSNPAESTDTNNATEPRPNLIIFMPDQLRYDSLGCFGNPHVQTPNIDAFATQGTKFTNCYLQATTCSQSRCSLYTGQYPHVSGHRSLTNLIKPWEPNMFRALKESGYHVACLAPRGDTFAPTVTELSVTEYGFLVPPETMPQFAGGNEPTRSEDLLDRLFYKGLRDQEKAVDYDEAAVQSAIKWLEHPPQGPWVLYLPLIFPHCPFQVEEPFFSMYDRAMMPIPSKPENKTGYEPRYFEENRKRYGTERATDGIWAEIIATYYGMISRLDGQFGRVMDAVTGTGLSANTVTVFYTDHGEYLGDHGMIEKWPSGVSEVLAREPLIIGGAGLPVGETNDEICEMVDLLPTILELCSVQESFPHNGVSLLPTLLRKSKHPKQYAYTEGGFLVSEEPLLEQAPYPYDIKSTLQHEDTEIVGKAVAMRSADWTYVYRLYEPAELYNRKTDIAELHNLAADPSYRHIVQEMQGEMFRWMVETADFLPLKKDARFPPVELESPEKQYEKRIQTL
ncbi:uncharacterized protein N7511_002756 [Penicillium nucicola]|uniref:uncharacterized protein n=1 Tax=Penicillium nucicola TaxID=1850975 RepID=UPI00254530E4|nr:uncharacterized protein N7511_002756 [Penicillium nucicola]KAJ5770705.1 hypothetical protein N7511_002756 [Penicillium nucicola]